MNNTIKLKSGYEIIYDDFEIDVDRMRVKLTCQFNNGNNKSYFNDAQEKQLVDNDAFELEYHGEKYSGVIIGSEIGYCGNLSTGIFSIEFIVKLEMDMDNYKNASKIRYVIPCEPDSSVVFRKFLKSHDGHSCSRECSVFVVNERTWLFKKAYRGDMGYVSYDMLLGHEKPTSYGYLLETDIEGNIDFESLNKEATHICHLLGFAVGKILMWESVWAEDAVRNTLVKMGNDFSSLGNNAKLSICCFDKGYNYSDPVEFVEAAWQEYFRDPNWWRITLLWFIHRWRSDAIEVQKLIEGILLDRICRKLLVTVLETSQGMAIPPKDSFRKIVNSHLKDSLNQLKAVPNDLAEDVAPFDTLLHAWVANPAYVEEISSMVEYAGGHLSESDKNDLELRHGFAHNGEATHAISNLLEYDALVSKYCLAIIMGMLGYSGYFRTNFKHFEVKSVLPNAGRLKLSRIVQLANCYGPQP